MREIFLLLVLIVAGRWLMKVSRRVSSPPATQARRARSHAQRDSFGGARASEEIRALAEPMVCCAVCGVHVPKSEVVVAEKQRFCCAAHAKQWVLHTRGREAR